MPKGYSYGGKHWTQQPQNKDRVRKMMAKRASFKKIAKHVSRGKKRGRPAGSKNVKKPTSLVVNGFRITLGNGEIRIDSE